MEDQYNLVFGNAHRVMAVFAHPDDLEISCGGTLARLLSDGRAVRTICMTAGERGTGKSSRDADGFKREREDAQRRAAAALGVPSSEVFNLGLQDGDVSDSLSTIESIVRHIRQFRPDIVITHNPEGAVHSFATNGIPDYAWVNHRDHRRTAQAVFDSVYPYSRDHAFFPDHLEAGLVGHEVHAILFSDAYNHKNAVSIDVQHFLAPRRAALECHIGTAVFTQDDVEQLMIEGQTEDGWFETLGWWPALQ